MEKARLPTAFPPLNSHMSLVYSKVDRYKSHLRHMQSWAILSCLGIWMDGKFEEGITWICVTS